jgi:hypothetical protein
MNFPKGHCPVTAITPKGEVEFRPPRGFSARTLGRGCVALVATALFLALGILSPVNAWIAVIPGLVAAGLFVDYAFQRRFRTRLTAQGIEARGYRTSFVPWASVRDVETVSFNQVAAVPVKGSRLTGQRASGGGRKNRKVAEIRVQNSRGHWLKLKTPVVTGE